MISVLGKSTDYLACVHDWLFFSNRAILLNLVSKIKDWKNKMEKTRTEYEALSRNQEVEGILSSLEDMYKGVFESSFNNAEKYILHGIHSGEIKKEFYFFDIEAEAEKELHNIKWPVQWIEFNTISTRSLVAHFVKKILTVEQVPATWER
jgi:hypothetical protein